VKKLYFKILFLILCSLSIKVYGQTNTPNSVNAYRISEKIVLDGELNEISWKKADKIENFRQREMEEGALPSERTQIAILYDDNNFYIGFWGFDSEPKKIISKQMKRDFRWGGEDNFEFILGTYNDKRNGFLFVTNPNGARADVLIGNEGKEFVKDWNGVWDVATSVNDSGWFAEIIIPFSTLSFQKNNIQNWEINFERNIRRKNEQLMWQGYLRKYEIENLSKAGMLNNLEGIKSKNNIEFKPYTTVGLEKQKGEKFEKIAKVGGEINTNITSTLKLNFTVNTDFAQVESDDAKVNLSRFNLYHEEKRQFFLEGSNNFEFKTGHRNHLFYSRQIRLENGNSVPILAGLRLFGKVGKNNIGFMTMQTDKIESENIQSNNFSILRYKRDIFNNSSAGFVITSKIGKEGRKNIVYGTDFYYKTSKFLKNKNLGFGGSIAKSYTSNADNTNSLSYQAYVSYFNDNVNAIIATNAVQTNYNPEMGFVRRNNYKSYYSMLGFKPRFETFSFIRNFIFIPFEAITYLDDKTNEMETFWYEFTPLGFVTKSGEKVDMKYQRTFERVDQAFELLDTVIVQNGDYWHNGYELGIETFNGRKISGEFQLNYAGFYQGTKSSTELAMNINFNKHLNFTLNWDRNHVNFPKSDFIVHEFGSKIEYAFNPKLYSSLFAQYNNEDSDLIFNYRINWIPKIGSDFYFVINQLIEKDSGKYTLKNTTVLTKFIWRFVY